MKQLWNFLFFQLGWFLCIFGAANHHIVWPVLIVIAYIILYISCSEIPSKEITLIFKVIIYGVSADTLLIQSEILRFEESWPLPGISPIWMWGLWAILATTLNSSMSWMKERYALAGVMGAVCGPLSYIAGISLGGGEWLSQKVGIVVLAAIWGVAMPTFMYWAKK